MSDATKQPAGPWLVWSNEHVAWWNPNSAGYTIDVTKAGRYSFAEARRICDGACYRAWSQNEGTGVPPEVMVPSPEMIAALALNEHAVPARPATPAAPAPHP